ncbi:MAG TPA: peroxidase family protein [Pseudonocardiaceae bacterium]
MTFSSVRSTIRSAATNWHSSTSPARVAGCAQGLRRHRPVLLLQHGPPRGRHAAQPPAVHAQLRRDDGMVVDLAAIDILRSRERVPLQRVRRLLRLSEARSFEDLTQTSQAVAELAAVYDSIQDVDLTVGLHAEPPPPGFSFADTAFRIFIVMASRRLAVTASSRATPIRKPTPPEGIR